MEDEKKRLPVKEVQTCLLLYHLCAPGQSLREMCMPVRSSVWGEELGAAPRSTV